MGLQNNEFSTLESLKSTKITFIVKALGGFILGLTVLGIIYLEIILIKSQKLAVEFKIASVIPAVILLSFLIYAVLKDTISNRKNQITKVIVDGNGLHHCQNVTIIESLTYTSLQPNPDLKNYDVVLSEGEDTAYTICLYYFDTISNAVTYKTIIFNTTFSIRNKKELERHFIKGVLMFRSDLKVSQKVLDLLNLK